jgi:Zn-dependent protease
VILFDLLWVNFGWGLFNLVPVLPLDGGMVHAELVAGRTRWSSPPRRAGFGGDPGGRPR